jgi:hypothetical protein
VVELPNNRCLWLLSTKEHDVKSLKRIGLLCLKSDRSSFLSPNCIRTRSEMRAGPNPSRERQAHSSSKWQPINACGWRLVG